ncbi:MAG: hypothetical protein LBH00_10840, partial [Planctomycetaceae bacterium]|nr:hypothetical protein [Planctomycetaceae bacterium]
MARAKQTKAAAKPAETTAQEYFLSYYKPVYPTDCRDIWFMDTDGIELQRGKSCFTTEYAPDPDYEGQCKRRVICGIHSECHRCKYICITYRCPEQQGVLTYRCSIGNLTDEEKDLLLKNIDILQEDGFDLSPLAIDTLTLDERLDHKEALKRFWSHVTYHTPQNGDD